MHVGPDFIVIVGRDKATVNPQHHKASHWLFVEMAVIKGGMVIIDNDATNEISDYIRKAGWTVEVR